MSRFSRLSSAGRWSAILAALFFLWHDNAVAEPATTNQREVGGEAPPLADSPPGWNRDLNTTLDVAVSWSLFQDPDMKQTYGGVPGVGLQATFVTSHDAAVYLAAGYGRSGGDPYYDTPGFDGDDAVALQILPLELGMRTSLTSNSRVGFEMGFGLQLVQVWETTPELDAVTLLAASERRSGWLTGFRLSFGPKWYAADRRHALGLSVSLGGSKGYLEADGTDTIST